MVYRAQWCCPRQTWLKSQGRHTVKLHGSKSRLVAALLNLTCAGTGAATEEQPTSSPSAREIITSAEMDLAAQLLGILRQLIWLVAARQPTASMLLVPIEEIRESR